MVRKQQRSELDEHPQVPTLEQAEEPRQSENNGQPEQPKERSESDARSIASTIHESNEAAKLL
ncbi:hypothetical protein FRC07_010011, partial [Ceratobasidium sp. 392]